MRYVFLNVNTGEKKSVYAASKLVACQLMRRGVKDLNQWRCIDVR